MAPHSSSTAPVVTANTSGANNAVACKFLELPGEIRNKIYEYVANEHEYNPDCNAEDHCPPLFKVNKQVHHEAKTGFFKMSTAHIIFRVPASPIKGLLTWLDQLGAARRRQLRRLTIYFDPLPTPTGPIGPYSWRNTDSFLAPTSSFWDSIAELRNLVCAEPWLFPEGLELTIGEEDEYVQKWWVWQSLERKLEDERRELERAREQGWVWVNDGEGTKAGADEGHG